LSGFRTYVGLLRSEEKLNQLLNGRTFARAVDVARRLSGRVAELESFAIEPPAET
jgi:hypothetical protein